MADENDPGDKVLEQDFSELQAVEDKIKVLNDELEEKMLELDKQYTRKKRPLFEERGKICSRIPAFWMNAICNHPQLQQYLNTQDYEVLKDLSVLDVEEIDGDGFSGTRYSFHFNKNKFFNNKTLHKEFKLMNDTGDIVVDTSTIEWKPGMNYTEGESKGPQAAGKRKEADSSDMSFFLWFDPEDDQEGPFGEWLRDDVFKDPFKWFCGEDEDEEEGVEYDGEFDEEEEEGVEYDG
eukprot:CAMPEP_0173425868 /NCGR_PEP_ID=MMETSP1357-20121228/5475_1 /TAXON_ID=77926 /ORGANISM="Hemiselmis rufescens, Strain PCC563" /LENGTH=235 /DNA_ID=CAMNT_0014389399 /DNA_START=9 /DNA_END=712 /DNA_ORIENTATION=-